MSQIYDLVIVGAGPSSLALAQCVSHLNKKILIIEKEEVIGGCHAVRRVNGLFTEHGPRVYSETYKVFQELLKEMDANFYDMFTKYNFSISEIGGETIFSTLKFSELFDLGVAFIRLLFNENYGRDTILRDFLIKHSFTNESYEIIDRVCKLTDGGGADKFTLNEFLQLFNQQFFYDLYQPKLPNDVGLFKKWREFLESRGVQFMLQSDIKDIKVDANKIISLTISTDKFVKTIVSNNYVFAIPPKNLNQIVDNFKLEHNWGDLNKYAKETAYIDYVSLAFHWDTPLKLKKVYGFPRSSWGLAFVILSDYMTFKEEESKTVMSLAITIKDKKSQNNNKTADECNKDELIQEVFFQLKEAFGDIPFPTKVEFSPGVKFESKEWISEDTAFIMTSNFPYLPFKNNKLQNMYTLGTHNGKSFYKFTSLESAVSNAVYFSKELYPELNDKKYITIKRSWSVSDVFNLVLLVIILYLIYKTIIR